MTSRTATSRNPRHAVTIIVVIAFYAIAVAMFGSWIRSTLGHQKQARHWHEKSQATWLADAGLRRAAAQLTSNTNYTGEQWQIEADQLGGKHTAAIQIRVEAVKESNGQFQISATAEYPAEKLQHARITKSTNFEIATQN